LVLLTGQVQQRIGQLPGLGAMPIPNPWLTTEELCAKLAISRSTLFAINRSALLKPGRQKTSSPGWHLCRNQQHY
jgi:hypothetical protein